MRSTAAVRGSTPPQRPRQPAQLRALEPRLDRCCDYLAGLVCAAQVAKVPRLRLEQAGLAAAPLQRALDQLQRALAVLPAREQLGHLVQHVGLIGRDLERGGLQVERLVQFTQPALSDAGVVERRPELGLQVQPQAQLFSIQPKLKR